MSIFGFKRLSHLLPFSMMRLLIVVQIKPIFRRNSDSFSALRNLILAVLIFSSMIRSSASALPFQSIHPRNPKPTVAASSMTAVSTVIMIFLTCPCAIFTLLDELRSGGVRTRTIELRGPVLCPLSYAPCILCGTAGFEPTASRK